MSAPAPHDPTNPHTAAHVTNAATAGTVPQANPPTLASHVPAVPGYELVRELARGGMGVVYLGRDPVFGRDVAVKVMFPGQNGDRFVVEARITGQLSHPGVPPVHALGTLSDGRPFLAMKLIAGRTLGEEFSARPGDTARHVSACERVCETVGFAHARGIVHRDIKPSNVMVGPFGEVLVLDWGLAKQFAPRTAHASTEPNRGAPAAPAPRATSETIAGAVKGTPAYMAPEQARGEPVDARADVFALGGLLAAALTGRPPFAGNTVLDTVLRAAQAELSDCFDRLDACGADPELVAVTKRCLAADPADRYSTGTEVAAALAACRARAHERVLAAERATAASAAEAREQRKRRKLQLALVTGAAAALVLVGAALWARDRQERLRERESARLEAELERNRSAADVRAARTRAEVEALLARSEDALRASDANTAGLLLAEADKRLREGGAEALAPRAARDRAALSTLRELLEIDRLAFTVSGESGRGALPTPAELGSRWARALAPLRVGGERAPPADALAAIAESPVRAQLTDALSRWFVAARAPALAATLDALDPEPLRVEIRKAVRDSDGRAVSALLARPEARALPRSLAVALAVFNDLPLQRRRELLLAALTNDPGDLNVLMLLGQLETHAPTSGVRGAGAQARWYQAAVAAHPGTVAAWNNLGIALIELGDPRAAVRVLERATELAPRLSTAWNNLGLARRETGDADGARAAYARALDESPNYAEAHTNLGALECAAGNRSAAAERFRRAIACDAKSAMPHSNLGLVQVELGQVEVGLESLRTAIRLDRTLPLAHNNLAVGLLAKGDPDGALAACAEALRLRPDYPEALHGRARAYQELGRFTEAIEACQEALKRRPTYSDALNTLGLLYRQAGAPEKALDALERAVALNPNSVPALNNLASALLASGNAEGALARYRKAIEANPNEAATHFNLGIFYERAGKRAEARAAYEAAVRCEPRYAAAHNNIGTLLSATGDFSGAIARYREALKHAPNYAPAHHNLGVALLKQNKSAEAERAFEAAVRSDPKLVHPLIELVKLRAATDLPGAFDMARRAVAVDPRSAEAHALLGKAHAALGRIGDARVALERAAALDKRFGTLLTLLPASPVAPPPRAK